MKRAELSATIEQFGRLEIEDGSWKCGERGATCGDATFTHLGRLPDISTMVFTLDVPFYCYVSMSYNTSVRMTYFADGFEPLRTPVPSCRRLPSVSPCGNIATLPWMGFTRYAFMVPSLALGRKKVVSPASNSSFRYMRNVKSEDCLASAWEES